MEHADLLPTSFPDPVRFDSSSVPSLRWAVLGPGHIANAFVTAGRRFTGQRFQAVGSRSAERARAFADQHDIPFSHGSYAETVARDDIDVVYVAAPASEHLALGLLAIAAGKHVLIEKPLATSAADGQRLADAARAAGILIMEGMWTRYLPQSSVLTQLVADGVLGRLELVLSDHGQAIRRDPEHRLWSHELGGGALGDLGIYPIAFSSQFLGAPEEILAQGALTPTGVDAVATLALRHAGGVQAVLSTTMLTSTPIRATLAGDRARIDIASPFFTPASFTLAAPGVFGDTMTWTEPTGMTGYDGLSWEANAVARFVDEHRTESPLHDLDETVTILRTIDDAREQLNATGRAIE
jgi:predicted dehydrogenase